MAKMNGMNANYKEVAGVLRTFEGNKAFARQVLDKMVEAGSKRTFNSVNATLAAMAGKGYVNKAKAVFNDKMLTCYTLTDAGIAELDKPEEEKEAGYISPHFLTSEKTTIEYENPLIFVSSIELYDNSSYLSILNMT